MPNIWEYFTSIKYIQIVFAIAGFADAGAGALVAIPHAIAITDFFRSFHVRFVYKATQSNIIAIRSEIKSIWNPLFPIYQPEMGTTKGFLYNTFEIQASSFARMQRRENEGASEEQRQPVAAHRRVKNKKKNI